MPPATAWKKCSASGDFLHLLYLQKKILVDSQIKEYWGNKKSFVKPIQNGIVIYFISCSFENKTKLNQKQTNENKQNTNYLLILDNHLFEQNHAKTINIWMTSPGHILRNIIAFVYEWYK